MSKPAWGGVTPYSNINGEVAIVGIGECSHSANSGRDPVQMGIEAVTRALDDAGLRPDQVDGLMFNGYMQGQLDAAAFHKHFGTSHDLWVSTEGGAMSWAATCAYTAAQAIRAKKATTIVNVFSIDWATTSKADGATPGDSHRQEKMKANLEVPFGWYPQPVYFATIARRHMHEFGTTAAQLGNIAVTLRRHANGHPGAVMHEKLLTLENYLAQKPFIDPLRLNDCCLISDGAAAYIMTSAERAKDFPQPPVTVLGVAEAFSNTGYYWSQQQPFTSTPQVFSAPAAYQMAGIDSSAVDVLAVYDPFTIVALMQIEDMGFCKKGEGGAFVEGDRLYFKNSRSAGGLPFNTHGGLLSHAYVLGISHVVELVRQLRGTAHNQVDAPQIAVYGGYTGGLASTLVLGRG
ncbi:MAG TPA: thiolase family protein [Spongiibacteraceae bacterium]|nr:thiolase family protein [Spongiibacteraceae bacterium]